MSRPESLKMASMETQPANPAVGSAQARTAALATDPVLQPNTDIGWFRFWQQLDLKALQFLHGLKIPRGLNWFLIAFVRIGDGWLWAGIAAWLWLALSWGVFKETVLQCLAAVAISLLLYWPLKLWAKRVRPYNALNWVTRKVPPLDKYSFPSGHTMNNLAVSLTLASLMPSFYAPAIGIPLVLGVLRVVFGVHFLTDILAGAVLGTLSHLGAKALFNFMAF